MILRRRVSVAFTARARERVGGPGAKRTDNASERSERASRTERGGEAPSERASRGSGGEAPGLILDLTGASWNQLKRWLDELQRLQTTK